ncbi:MAG: hypothetical protein QGF64_06745 [Candidatus Poseidoniia archaeon]|jgi:hypothetical protein|nr:hypothetical protein [Candidatus Poseidoniia archaeon]|tara:strand:- start:208 stop:747 length:540 start_codon:yes stop_codon:yes gene_type:complete
MPPPTRITIAFTNGEAALLKKLSREMDVSVSELIRRTTKFYFKYQNILEGEIEIKIKAYLDLLLNSEHQIIDIERWILFMKIVESLPSDHEFWSACIRIAKDQAEEFKGKIIGPQAALERFENCNWFRLQKNSENEFTLVLNSEMSGRFVEFTVSHLLNTMGYKADLKTHRGKIRIRLY